jgi:hypothetical protein
MITFWQILAVGAFGLTLGYLAHWWTARKELRKLRRELDESQPPF